MPSWFPDVSPPESDLNHGEIFDTDAWAIKGTYMFKYIILAQAQRVTSLWPGCQFQKRT